MRARTTIAATLGAVTLLAACGLTGTGTQSTTSLTGSAPSTSAGGPTTATVAAPTTAANPSGTTAPAAAPSTTAAGPTTTRPDVVIGPPLNLVTLVESPAETRNTPPIAADLRGVLVKASHPDLERSFVFSMVASTFARAKPAPGWTFTVLNKDRQWTPASCGATATVFVGHRWEVYIDAPAAEAPSGDGTVARPQIQLVSFDVEKKAFASYLESPNKVTWFSNNLQALDDHTVGILFDPDPADLQLRTGLVLRRIDLANGRVSDERIELPKGASYNYPYLATDGAITLYGLGTDQVLHRPADGKFTVLPVDAVQPERLVDGLFLDYTRADPAADGDVPLVDKAGKVIAQIHQWRFAANGPGIGYYGFANGRAYFGAFVNKGEEGGPLNLGAYDTGAATWSWVFDAASPMYDSNGGGYEVFVAGTT